MSGNPVIFSTCNIKCVLELAKLFDVSTDTILGKKESASISVSGLSDSHINAVLNVVQCFRESNNKNKTL
jgi:hypothetical protein